MKLEQLSALELGTKVNNKEISPVEVFRYFKERIQRRNPSINAFTYTKFEEAEEESKKIEKKIMEGIHVGPFAGVPVGLKDFLPSKVGWTNSHGGVKSLVRYDDTDSEFWKAARKLGAVAYGKTNAPAFGFSGACQNKLYGATCNPFDITRTSGGSSGGSAAAVADGLLLLAEGGDAGGSIRIPSGWCNLFGFKPSKGTVPSYCRPDGWTATHPFCFNGALTKTVADSAVMLNEMSYYNPRDPISLPINSDKNFLRLMTKGVKGMRIGFTYDFNLFPAVDEEVKKAVYSTAMLLESAGAYIEPLSFSWKFSLEEIMRTWAWSISVDTALDMQLWKSEGLDLIKDHRDELPEEFIEFNEMASRAGINYMRIFNEIRTNILDNFEDAFEKYDLIISPTAICSPMKHEDEGRCKRVNGVELDPETNFISFGETALVNFVGYPAASVPAGIIYDTLPVGMQIIAPMFRDEDIFAASHVIEMLKPWNYDLAFNRP